MSLNLTKQDDAFVVFENFSRKNGYVQSPFRYPGGKFYALKYIVPMLDCVPHEEYREPFVGGGCVFFAKRKAKINWLNDLESDLIAIYLAIKEDQKCKTLSDRISKETATRERHFEVKNMVVEKLDDIAFKYYYLNRTSYSGIINKPAWGYEPKKSSPPENWPRFLNGANKKLQDTKITCFDFEGMIRKKSKHSVLMYLDPPYYHADQKRAYTKPFEAEDHIRLEKVLRETNHFFCLSYDDCPEIRELYDWANIHERNWFYNTANSSGPRKVANELLITNYDVIPNSQRSLF